MNSWWQLITVDEIEYQPGEPKFGTGNNFSVYIKILVIFLSAVNSWLHVVKAEENENQLKKLKFGTHINFSVHMKIQVDFLYGSCH